MKAPRKSLNELKIEQQKLKQSLNLTNLKLNDSEQYERRENIRIQETDCDKDDREDVVFHVANALDIEPSELDPQKVQRLGKKKTSLAKL